MSKEQQPHHIAIPIVREKVITPDGRVGTEIDVISNSREAFEAFKGHLEKDHGDEVIELDPNPKQGNSRSFGFSNWSMCAWEPKGPKRPWMNSENPSKN